MVYHSNHSQNYAGSSQSGNMNMIHISEDEPSTIIRGTVDASEGGT